MNETEWEVELADEPSSTRFATYLGERLLPGDTILISGALGAGKSHIARGMIRARLRAPETPVPSPSYTLVNVYSEPDGSEIWHADLYRLVDPEDLVELGLEDATQHSVVLVEWPERWGAAPERHLALDLRITGEQSRHLTLRTHGSGWNHVTLSLEAIAG